MVEAAPQWRRRKKAPLGIYLCGGIVILKFGILNSIGYFAAFRSINGDAYLPVVVVSFALSLFTAGAAVWAMTADNAGRLAMMILLPLNVLWPVLLLVPPLLGRDQEIAGNAMMAIISQTFLTIWVIAIEVYFLTKKVVEYYKQDV